MKDDFKYIILDLKSFYASVECVERGYDPFKTNLVVADPEREKGTICLAITPALKALGVKNRCRVFEIPEHIDYIIAPPRMQLYIDYAATIYGIYLKYVSKEDIHVYSIDEAFLDISKYKNIYHKSAREIGMMIRDDIFRTTGITATCGIGTNLYLAKIALDITAKRTPEKIGELTEESYRKLLWNHRPLTDFWMIGHGKSATLARYGIYTMKDITEFNPDTLYKIFGVDAELLIDHAWGRESATMEDIKRYKAKGHSVSTGQVLPRDYNYEEAEIIVKEMTDVLCLDLVEQELITESLSLYIGYSHTIKVPSSNGTVKLMSASNSAVQIVPQMAELYKKVTLPNIPIRRITVCANRVQSESYRQYDLYHSPEKLEREKAIQKAMISIKKRYGKNAVVKGMNLYSCGTTIQRNNQIGGHKA